MADKVWYDKHWKSKETPEFNKWFLKDYGVPEDFSDSDDDEYWVRKAFALMGWLEAIKTMSGEEG
jgi:hypothetical protein